MNREGLVVELFGKSTSPEDVKDYLSVVYDRSTNTYYYPLIQGYNTDPFLLAQQRLENNAVTIAFLDSGMLESHPLIRSRLKASVDFTGEGPNDTNGHGSLVALTSISANPKTAVINVKVLSESGYGKMSWLASGLNWCSSNAEKYNIKVVNLSAGIYHRKWGILECSSNCDVCKAAKALHRSGVSLVCAAGNEGASMLPCPQRIGVLDNLCIVVAASDPVSNILKEYSGKGTIAAPELRYRRIPMPTNASSE